MDVSSGAADPSRSDAQADFVTLRRSDDSTATLMDLVQAHQAVRAAEGRWAEAAANRATLIINLCKQGLTVDEISECLNQPPHQVRFFASATWLLSDRACARANSRSDPSEH